MIRLAVSGGPADRAALAARLDGAQVAAYAAPGDQPPEPCDAALWLDPSPADAEAIRRCLLAGAHVLLAARSWLAGAALDALCAAARRAGVQLAVENADRFLPSRQLVRQQVDAGRLGEPGLVRAHRWRPARGENGAGADLEDVWAGGGVPTPLAQDVDTALWLMGRAPDLVYAVERVETVEHAGQPEPLEAREGTSTGRIVQLHLGFPGGGMALIDYAETLPPGDGYRSLSLIGSTGAAYADDHQNTQLVYRGGQPRAVGVGEGEADVVALARAFVAGVAAGRDLSAGVTAWRAAVAVAQAARRAAAAGRALALALPPAAAPVPVSEEGR